MKADKQIIFTGDLSLLAGLRPLFLMSLGHLTIFTLLVRAENRGLSLIEMLM